jgi:excisionase family DNA binding protein
MPSYTKMVPDDLRAEWVTIHEAAGLLAVTRQTVNRLIREKSLATMKYIGGRRFVSRASIAKLARSYAAAPTR